MKKSELAEQINIHFKTFLQERSLELPEGHYNALLQLMQEELKCAFIDGVSLGVTIGQEVTLNSLQGR